jgi:hypothetical protein
MGAITESVGNGINDAADVTLTLRVGEDILSPYTINSSSTYVSGGFDSLGNAYTARPIGITDVTVRVGTSGGSSNVGIRPAFKTSLSGKSPSRVNSTVVAYTGMFLTLYGNPDASVSTEPTYVYPAFTSDAGYYGFRGFGLSGSMQYGRGGNGFVESVYQLISSTLTSADRLSGNVTQASIPGPVRTPNALSITDTSANIIWSAPIDDGMQSPAAYSASNIKGYRINYRNSGAENWKVLVANTGSSSTSRVVPGLSPSTYYEIQVAALNAVTDAHNSSYANITAHVGERSITHPFTTAVSTNDIRVWTGTEFKKGIVKIWNGSAWLEYPNITAKVWNGTAFEDVTLDS